MMSAKKGGVQTPLNPNVSLPPPRIFKTTLKRNYLYQQKKDTYIE